MVTQVLHLSVESSMLFDPYALLYVFKTYVPARDAQMRYVMAFQTMVQPREMQLKEAFGGGGNAGRGRNPALLAYPPGAVDNIGISTLRIDQAYGDVTHVRRFSDPEVVLIGLGFFQFGGLAQTEPRFEPGLGSCGLAIEMYLASLASGDAVLDSLRGRKPESPRDDNDGPWSRDGYRETAPQNEENTLSHLGRASPACGNADIRLPRPIED